jgi:hypothetical protein
MRDRRLTAVLDPPNKAATEVYAAILLASRWRERFRSFRGNSSREEGIGMLLGPTFFHDEALLCRF